jgi:hypothetical protein
MLIYVQAEEVLLSELTRGVPLSEAREHERLAVRRTRESSLSCATVLGASLARPT